MRSSSIGFPIKMEILGVVALAWPPPSTALIEAVTQVPAPEFLEMMRTRGLVSESHGEWVLGANLFRARVLDALGDPDGVRVRIKQHRLKDKDSFIGLADDIEAMLERGRQQVLRGAFQSGLFDLSRAVDLARGLQDRALEARALRSHGQALLELGQLGHARSRLADATALARASGEDQERRLCHVLRASISLGMEPQDGSGVLSALDRLMPLEVGARARQSDRADRMMQAVWTEVCALLGDAHGARRREAIALTDLSDETSEWRVRIRLCLARGSSRMGQSDRSESFLMEARRDAQTTPLLLWWVEAALHALRGERLSLPAAMAAGLTPDQRRSLEDLAHR